MGQGSGQGSNGESQVSTVLVHVPCFALFLPLDGVAGVGLETVQPHYAETSYLEPLFLNAGRVPSRISTMALLISGFSIDPLRYCMR